MRKFGNVTKFSSLQKVCCVSGPHLFDLDPDHCSRSGSVGFVSFWTSWIRVRNYLYRSGSGFGSGSCSGSFHQQAKKLRKILNSAVLWLLSWKTDINVLPLRNNQKTYFVGIMTVTDEKSRIRIRKTMYRSKDTRVGIKNPPKKTHPKKP